MAQTKCASCGTTQGPFVRRHYRTRTGSVSTRPANALCRDLKGCTQRRAALDEKRYGRTHRFVKLGEVYRASRAAA